jgi:hypothetical protein
LLVALYGITTNWTNCGAHVSTKRRFRSIVAEAIASKEGLKEISVKTFRSDADAILESLVGELDEKLVVEAMNRQGLTGEAYRSTLRTLTRLAQERRVLRNTV